MEIWIFRRRRVKSNDEAMDRMASPTVIENLLKQAKR